MRRDPPNRSSEQSSIYERHRSIGYNGGELLSIIRKGRDSFGSICRDQCTIACLFKSELRDLPNICFVVNDQNQLAFALGRSIFGFRI